LLCACHAVSLKLIKGDSNQKVEVASNKVDLATSCKTVKDCQQQLELLGITESLPFLQYFNTWRQLPAVKELAYSLAQAAATFLDVPSVRLYQDAVFLKKKKHGRTPFHVDARMAPFDTSSILTFWIPLQEIPKAGTGLLFCSKSQADFALPYWNPLSEECSQESEWNRLEHRYPKQIVDYMPMRTGDLTIHSGWTLHCANENDGSHDRVALAISYVDAQAELRVDALDTLGKGDNEDQWSYREWAREVTPRTKFRHDLVPIVWPRSIT
jgi:ectoine hydroxylase-related dioxygenase (phytanoyl-CoA dioxygenase family)